MNLFIETIVKQLLDVGIYPLLVKGQGVAQCYGRPRWRAEGDVDFVINRERFI